MGLFSYEDLRCYIDGNNKEKRMTSWPEYRIKTEYSILKGEDGYLVKLYRLDYTYYVKGFLWWQEIARKKEWAENYVYFSLGCITCKTEKEAREEVKGRYPNARERDKVI